VGDINSPTTYNAGFHFVQFWDGRAADLEEQADGPVNNPVEMASSWPEVIGKLEKDEALKKEFVAVYPDGYSSENIRNAIAEFERSLVTPDSRFDKFLVGDTEALSRDEREGHRLFMDRGCAACHVGKILGGQSYEKMGEHGDYFADRGGEVKKADLGRFNVTGKEADRHRFKVPTLRNVEQTAPYFHDGATTNLRDAVKIMARYQTDDGLTNQEAELVARFLRSLTGEYGGTLVQ
jgi:cytochrome c peroxidase